MHTWDSVDESNFFDAMKKVAEKRIPGVKIKYKNESIWMKLLGLIVFFNRDFMKTYTSTFFMTVWFPSKNYVNQNIWRAGKILAHELVHLCDEKEHSILFKLLYLWPQFIAMFSIVSIMAIWFSKFFLCGLVFLVFLAPFKSFPRAQLELRAYAMTMAINAWKHGYILDKTKEDIASQFVGPGYYYMWPNKTEVMQWLNNVEDKIRNIDVAKKGNDTIFNMGDVFEEVYSLITGFDMEE